MNDVDFPNERKLQMVVKNQEETIEFFIPKMGLDLEPYIRAESKQGIHHLGRYYWAIEVLKKLPPGRILDIACGAGYGSLLLSQNLPDFQIIGGDYDSRAISYAKKHFKPVAGNNVMWRQIDVVTWKDLGNEKGIGKYDYIVSFDTIEHLLHREVTLTNFAENLHDGGRLFFSTPCGRSNHLLNPGWEHHKIEYSSAGLYNLMRRFFGEVLLPDDRSLPEIDFWSKNINTDKVRYFLRVNPLVCAKPIRLGFDLPVPTENGMAEELARRAALPGG